LDFKNDPKVKLQCLAGGEPQPEVTWLKNGVPIKEVERHHSLKSYKEKPGKAQKSPREF